MLTLLRKIFKTKGEKVKNKLIKEVKKLEKDLLLSTFNYTKTLYAIALCGLRMLEPEPDTLLEVEDELRTCFTIVRTCPSALHIYVRDDYQRISLTVGKAWVYERTLENHKILRLVEEQLMFLEKLINFGTCTVGEDYVSFIFFDDYPYSTLDIEIIYIKPLLGNYHVEINIRNRTSVATAFAIGNIAKIANKLLELTIKKIVDTYYICLKDTKTVELVPVAINTENNIELIRQELEQGAKHNSRAILKQEDNNIKVYFLK